MHLKRSNSQPLQQAHLVPRHEALEDAGEGQPEPEQGEDVESGPRPATFSGDRKGRELLEALNLESMRVVLVAISGVPVHESVEGSHEPRLACVFGEVVALEIVDENIVPDIQDVSDLSALVSAISHVISLSCSVSHYFSPAGALLRPNCHVVVALDPEGKVAPSLNHLVVGLLVIRISLHVADVLPQLTAGNRQDQVEHIGHHQDGDSAVHLQEATVSHTRDDYAGEEDDRAHQQCNVQRGLYLNWLVGLLERGIADVEEHCAEAIGDALVAGVESVGRHGCSEVDGLHILLSHIVVGSVHLHHYKQQGINDLYNNKQNNSNCNLSWPDYKTQYYCFGSDRYPFEQADIVPGHVPLEETSIRQYQASQREEEEFRLRL